MSPGISLTSGSLRTMNAVMPVWRGDAPGSVTASSITSPARRPFVTHIFCPLITNSSPSRTARVRIACTSEPACGSVIENAERTSPRAICGSSSSFCSGVPNVLIMNEAMKCVLITPDSEIQPRESSLTISA